MVRRCLRLALGLALPALVLPAFLLPALAQGTPRSIGECERLKNDLAYNQCLAMFGPPARSVASGDGAGAAPAPDYAPGAAAAAGIPSPDEPELSEPSARGRRGRSARRGRQGASFAIAVADDAGAEVGAARRAHRRYRRRR